SDHCHAVLGGGRFDDLCTASSQFLSEGSRGPSFRRGSRELVVYDEGSCTQPPDAAPDHIYSPPVRTACACCASVSRCCAVTSMLRASSGKVFQRKNSRVWSSNSLNQCA